MKTLTLPSLVLIGMSGYLGGCKVVASQTAPLASTSSASQSLTPKLDKKKVIQLARDYAESNRMDLARYTASEPKLTVIGGQKKWDILYFPKGDSVVGDHFSLIIDDETQTVGIFGGM